MLGVGYVTAIADANLLGFQKSNSICIPVSTKRIELFHRVCDYYSDNPESFKQLTALTVRRAYQKYFPCRVQNIDIG
jgi:hypothetical protein